MIRLFRRQPQFVYPGEELRPASKAGRAMPVEVLDAKARRALETGRTRMLVTAGLFALVFASISVRLVDLMVLKADPRAGVVHRPAATAPHTERADIVDRNGVVLATNLPAKNLFADARRVLDPKDATARLVAVLPGLDRKEVYERLSSGRPFVYLARNLMPREQQLVNDAGIPGLYFEDSEYRAYLHGPLAAHVLGATDLDNKGIAGVERTFDERLRAGEPLRLTIDIRVQHAVRKAMQEGMTRFKAKAGTAVVLDVHSGEIISMVSLPDYDPERFGSADEDARFNRATLGVYEMGSTFKVFNTALALESGKIRLHDTYDTTKPLRIARFSIRDSHPENRWLNVSEILVHSSNIGSARMAMDVGPDAQRAFLGSLGMLRPLNIGLPESGAPLYPERWRDISTMTISFGHGIAVTPMHLSAATAAMVNGGVLRTPTLVAENIDAQGQRVVSPQTSEALRRLMRLVVQDGTAKKADVFGYRVGGKTGTSEKAAGGGYDTKRLLTSFVSAFPMDDPRYVVLVSLDEPQPLKETFGFATSGWNAAPTGGKVIEAIAPLLGVFPRSEDADDKAVREALLKGQMRPYMQASTGGSHAPTQ
ncbi:peptidoglycan D,D-transpeptidase FtsI family protein [Novispirillum sp. DQ9]|uniref:peptidoglycan D,D-transpeptidase FtsI family protein n=1 Tax=Novispirillum sp. DQ9 TaxID=3398612 RepID=UPI003C7B5801